MRLVNKLQTFKPIYMAVGSGGSGIGGRDPHLILRNRFWKVRTRRRPPEESDWTADGSGPVGLSGWVGFAGCLDSPRFNHFKYKKSKIGVGEG